MRPSTYAFAAAAGFLGAAIYICLVEQPARLKLGSRAMIKEWTLSNHRGTLMLSVLAVISAVLGYIQFRETDAGLGTAGMGSRPNWVCCGLRVRVGAGLAGLIDGRQCTSAAPAHIVISSEMRAFAYSLAK
jgi:hypothetical protein